MDPLTEADLVCHTNGCVNEGVVIRMLVCDKVFCGPCGNEITDVTLVP